MKLDLGCGHCPAEGYIGVDILAIDGIVQCDLNQTPWPFEDKSIEVIRMSHSLEHLSNLDATFFELSRILKDNGSIEVVIPYCLSEAGFYPGHSLFLGTEFFHYNKCFNDLFIITKIDYGWNKELLPLIDAIGFPRELAAKTLWNVVKSLEFSARKRVVNDGIWIHPE